MKNECLAKAIAFLIPCIAMAETPAPKSDPILEMTKPFWASTLMRGESILFVGNEGKPRPACNLLFVPTKILSITSSDGTTTYEEGKDFKVSPGSSVVEVPEGSAIPVADPAHLTPPLGTQPCNLKRRDGKGDILFGATPREYADMQVVVTYEHRGDDWKLPPPKLAEKELPRTLTKLRGGSPLTVVLFGDSISAGGQASGHHEFAPFQPPFGNLVVQTLERTYKSPITFKNVSKGGMGAEWGLSQIATVTEEHPDLVILAGG